MRHACAALLGVLIASWLALLLAVPAVAAPIVDRVAGGDRYETAAEVSRDAFAPGVSTVYVATGEHYPDALAGGPAAARRGGPVLLVARHAVPPATAAELERLRPDRIAVLGGTSAVSERVLAALRAHADRVDRVAGADRYATAAAIAADAFPNGAATVFIATGTGFPDALAGGAAAGAGGGPVLLVRPDGVPAATAHALDDLSPSKVIVLGGPGAVSDATLAALEQRTGAEVSRLAAADRYATSAAVARAGFFDEDGTVYVATGLAFPDGLAAGSPAGRADAPLLLVPGTCVPRPVLEAMEALAPARVVVLGGHSAVSQAVESLTPCPAQAATATDPAVGIVTELRAKLDAERSARGLPRLAWDSRLAAMADEWAGTIAETGFRHRSDLFPPVLEGAFSAVGENIHRVAPACAAPCTELQWQASSGVVHSDWMRSADHRDTMLSPAYEAVGIGVRCDAGGTLWAVANFGRYVGSDAPSEHPATSSAPLAEPDNGGMTCAGRARAHNPDWPH